MKEEIKKYDKPAGGWGALKAVYEATKNQHNIHKDMIALFEVNKPTGFDCPGCAWPDSKTEDPVMFCENGAKAVTWEATSKKVDVDFFKTHSVTELLTWSDFDLENSGRLTNPMKYNLATDHYEPIDWQQAFNEIGAQLRTYSDPNVVEFYTSGRASNESAFLYQLFAREYGTNNFPDCSNMCHEPTSVGLAASIGIGKGTVLLEDFDKADLVICIGHNPGTNHPRMLGTLRSVSKRGAQIIAINPLREVGLEKFTYPQNPIEMLTGKSTPLASHYYHVRVGGDIALLKGIMRVVLERHETAIKKGDAPILDLEFIHDHTFGFEALKADILSTDWQVLETVSGIEKAYIEQIAELYISAKRTIICYAMGITQHEHGTQNVEQLVNLLLLKGNIGREGAGICPLRGHSNVQGDRTVGITEKPNADLIKRLEDHFGFTVPKEFGHAAVATAQAIYEGRSKALFSLGGNFAIAMPDHQKTIQGMKGLDLSVMMITKLNRTALLTGKQNYIFPVLGRTEIDIQESGPQKITVEDSMSMVHASMGALDPISEELKSECAIIANIAKATLPNTKVNWDAMIFDYSRIRDAIEVVFPIFYDFNERIEEPGGFHLENSAAQRQWKTASGKANFILTNQVNEDPNEAQSELVLTNMRSHDQYNTTIYGFNDRYRGIEGRRDVVFISAAEAEKQNVKAGDQVDLIALDQTGKATDRSLAKLTVVIYEMADRCVATYFPECNDLMDLSNCDPQSGIPAYKSVPIKLVKQIIHT